MKRLQACKLNISSLTILVLLLFLYLNIKVSVLQERSYPLI